jgi:hypothetical protein
MALTLHETIAHCREEIDNARLWRNQHQQDGSGNMCLCMRSWPCKLTDIARAQENHFTARLAHAEQTLAALTTPTQPLADLASSESFADLVIESLPLTVTAAQMRQRVRRRWTYRLWHGPRNLIHGLWWRIRRHEEAPVNEDLVRRAIRAANPWPEPLVPYPSTKTAAQIRAAAEAKADEIRQRTEASPGHQATMLWRRLTGQRIRRYGR